MSKIEDVQRALGKELGSGMARRALAVAAIEAMREPSTSMILSCADLPCSQQEMWARSIDAALSEPAFNDA